MYQVLEFLLSWSFRSRGCFNWFFFVYIKVYSLFLGLYVFVSLCFINSIHSKNIHPKIKSSFCRFLCFVSSTFNMCHIFIGSTSFMFYVLGLFLRFFHSFSYKLVGRHLKWNAFKWKCSKRCNKSWFAQAQVACLLITFDENLILMTTLLLFHK